MPKYIFKTLGLALALVLTGAGSLQAQTYPDRVIKLTRRAAVTTRWPGWLRSGCQPRWVNR